MKRRFSWLLAAGIAVALGFAGSAVVSPEAAQANPPTIEFVQGTFRTPTGGAAECPNVPEGTDCQIDAIYGDIGGPDDGTNPGAADWLLTVYIHEDEPWPGFWEYLDQEKVTDPTRGVEFSGYESGTIDARQGTTGDFNGNFIGATADGCQLLVFHIEGNINLGGMAGGEVPVNIDYGTWSGTIVHLC